MSTGLDVFDSTIERTNQLLSNIEIELGWEGHRHQTYKVLRSVLHALRDRLPVEVAANLSAQFPLLLKGIFFDGWKPEETPLKMSAADFLERIQCEIDLELTIPILDLVRIVLGQVFYSIDLLELEKIKRILPPEFADLFEAVSL